MKDSGPCRVQITLSTGAWLLILTAFAVGFACGCLVEEIRLVMMSIFNVWCSPC